MKIQSLSVVVPTKGCVNNCKFCVAHMRDEEYKNQMDTNLPFYDLYERDYLKRLEFARDNGCNTIMLTGNSEPQQNRIFLAKFGTWNAGLDKPFRWIEMQTTGVMIDDGYLRFLRNHVGVSTISVSLSSLDSEQNQEYNGTPDALKVDIEHLCSEIKRYDFNLRLSLNLTDYYDDKDISRVLNECRLRLGANQITFRELYASGMGTAQDEWIEEHGVSPAKVVSISKYIKDNGEKLEQLPFGAYKYSLHGMSVVLDDDCMSKEVKDGYKYLILRPDCKLYSRWDDPASLIF